MLCATNNTDLQCCRALSNLGIALWEIPNPATPPAPAAARGSCWQITDAREKNKKILRKDK